MKKILLLMAIILPFVFTSCGDDKDEPKQSLEEQLIGSWVGDEYTVVDGKVVIGFLMQIILASIGRLLMVLNHLIIIILGH